ncbi:hypothetical protein [Novosphingopyxis sp.]|uniref:hypothetical protein n=1 Tax=Novosphingopyxis sp. TaxID=2709690 RepID=UPI003B5C0BFF
MTMKTLYLTIAATGLGLAFAAPARAQDNAGDRVQVLAVYGEDACPPSTDEEIVVCKRYDESERYRIPRDLRASDSPENRSWTDRVRALETIGKGGIGSCTPTGPGGVTGCTQELIRQAYAERAEGSDIQAGRLVEEARAERLARIDADAAETERLVQEELARRDERERRQAAIAAGEDPDAAVDDTPLPEPQL